MAKTNTIARTLHDLGLAAWFGGSLMGAVGVNGAAAAVDDPRQRTRVANVGWARWTPVNAVAIGAHVLGSAQLLLGNKGRTTLQSGVRQTSALKTGLLVASLAATGYSRILGQKVMQDESPSEGATEPTGTTPDETASAQRQLKALQWVVPALTGALLIVNARMGEQQRPMQVVGGVLRRVTKGS